MIALPKHVALIPDGNRRWARRKGLPTFEGHRRGFKRVVELGDKILKMGIPVFTVWAFSTENWKRSKKEVNYLMGIYERWIDENLAKALKDKVRIVHLGRKDRISASLRRKLIEAERKTKQFKNNFFCVALDYGGHDELLRATNKARGKVDEDKFSSLLDTKSIPYPNPDLIIRTSGEQRTSGFLPWQSAYAELIFAKKYLPDFTAKDLENFILEYSKRQRRFGK